MVKNPNKSFFWSVIIAIIILIAFAFSSCVTQKQRERILKDCPVSSSEKTSDSTSKKETIKHDSIFISVPGPIRYFPSPCETMCDSLGNLKPFKIETKKNGIKQTLESVGNVLIQKCDIDSLLQVNEKKTIEINRLIKKEKETQVHEICKIDHFTDLDIFFIISAKIIYLILIIYLLWRLLKVWLKKYMPFIK